MFFKLNLSLFAQLKIKSVIVSDIKQEIEVLFLKLNFSHLFRNLSCLDLVKKNS